MSAATERIIVGLGADGWAGLPDAARATILAADAMIGAPFMCERRSVEGPIPSPRMWMAPLDRP